MNRGRAYGARPSAGFAAIVAAIVAALVFATAGGAAHSTTYAPKDCTKPRVRPSRIILTCADAGLGVKVKHWTHWNGHNAAGKGKVFAKDCTPDCASGSFHTYAAKVKLTKPHKRSCGGRKGIRMFTRLKFHWKGDRPAGVPSKWKLYCSA